MHVVMVMRVRHVRDAIIDATLCQGYAGGYVWQTRARWWDGVTRVLRHHAAITSRTGAATFASFVTNLLLLHLSINLTAQPQPRMLVEIRAC